MGRTYKLKSKASGLDRDALIRAVSKLDLRRPGQRWRAYLIAENTASRLGDDVEGWLWAYGFGVALAGHPQPEAADAGSPAAEGYRTAGELIRAARVAVELDAPLPSGCTTWATASQRTRDVGRERVLLRARGHDGRVPP